MVYPFMTLNDNTEIVHSEMHEDGRVLVHIETPDEKVCFKHADCWLPEYKWEDVYELLCGIGAYLDTSFSLNPVRPLDDTKEGWDSLEANPILVPPLKPELFRKMVEKNGVDHMLFASDSPWGDQKETFELVDECLDESEKKAVYYGNALRLLELPELHC